MTNWLAAGAGRTFLCMLTIQEAELRGLVTPADAVAAVERGFAQLARGEVVQPEPLNFAIPALDGEIHVKGAYALGAEHIVLKLATGFWRNADRGLPTGSGLMFVLEAATGFPHALLLDNGYLTDLRTGAAGAVAAKWLARSSAHRVLLVGAGVQARFQLQCLATVHRIESVTVWSRTHAAAQRLAAATSQWCVRIADDLAAAVADSTLVITVTPSHGPLIKADWIRPGTHITAVGSDGPDKQELDVGVLARADVLVADRLSQCARLGEIHHGMAAGVVDPAAVLELGDVIIGRHAGRTHEEQITVCDLTGVGAQDAAIASLALERYRVAR
ncbi:MAG TPA: hypothetical protein VK864_12155 [Longimicrobiales bacterium]|nr:hypothetical protein [Longimicrobiales bacterium]